MFKTNEFKAYGSIRKTKKAGVCGVILAFAMMAIFAQGNASADEVKPSSPATTQVAKSATEVVKQETQVFPALAGVIPVQKTGLNINLCFSRTRGGDPTSVRPFPV